METLVYYGGSLYHHGTKGQKWGIRRYQNEDGSLTEAGRARYASKLEREAEGSGKLTVRNTSKAATAYEQAKLRERLGTGTRTEREIAFQESRKSFKANKTVGQRVANGLINGFGAGAYNNLRASGHSVAVSYGASWASAVVAGPVGQILLYELTKKQGV